MSEFYRVIRECYDNIFPLSKKQVDFIVRNFERGCKILEVGCANGKLSNALSENFGIVGIDVEDEFVEIAKSRFPEVDFLTLNMLDVDSLPGMYDGIVCFGNTLAHINHSDVQEFLNKAYSKLISGGKILMQIVNYDYILGNMVGELPLIDNDVVRFERYYDHGDKFIFRGKLEVKRSGLQFESEVELFPILSNELTAMLEEAGFDDIMLFGSFDGEVFNNSSKALIVSGVK